MSSKFPSTERQKWIFFKKKKHTREVVSERNSCNIAPSYTSREFYKASPGREIFLFTIPPVKRKNIVGSQRIIKVPIILTKHVF